MDINVNITIKFDKGDLNELKKLKLSKTENSKRSVSTYARMFDETCPRWSTNRDENLTFIITKRLEADRLLKTRGFLFLNEVYDLLGMARTDIGNFVGWVYDEENPVGDNFVDFDTDQYLLDEGDEKCVNVFLLDFNVDGDIIH